MDLLAGRWPSTFCMPTFPCNGRFGNQSGQGNDEGSAVGEIHLSRQFSSQRVTQDVDHLLRMGGDGKRGGVNFLQRMTMLLSMQNDERRSQHGGVAPGDPSREFFDARST